MKLWRINIDYLDTNTKKTRYNIIKYNINNGCWICVSHKPNGGYARIRYNGEQILLHRFIYEYFNKKLRKNQVVRHKCDNKLCINPSHLISGTNLDNIKDRQKRNRQARGEKIGNSKLTSKDIKYIKRSTKNGLQLSKELNVSHSTIYRVKNNQTWRHIK